MLYNPPIIMRPSDCFICLQNVSKQYVEGKNARSVLQGVSASFQPGEFVAIVGKSGTGKSTLLNLIGGIDLVDGGSIWIKGLELSALDELQRTLFRRQYIGFIFQFFNLIPTLTVAENVSLPLELNGLTSRQARDRSTAMLDRVHLADRLDTFPENLSGGEQQRVAIARALVHDPVLILADEPTGNLDEETGQQVLTLLDRVSRQDGKNLILVTHSLEAARMADRTLILREGHLVSDREVRLAEMN